MDIAFQGAYRNSLLQQKPTSNNMNERHQARTKGGSLRGPRLPRLTPPGFGRFGLLPAFHRGARPRLSLSAKTICACQATYHCRPAGHHTHGQSHRKHAHTRVSNHLAGSSQAEARPSVVSCHLARTCEFCGTGDCGIHAHVYPDEGAYFAHFACCCQWTSCSHK